MKQNKNKISCNFCNSKLQKTIYSKGIYPVVSCIKCGLVFLSPRPGALEIADLYKEEYFQKEESSFGYKDYEDMKNDLRKEAERRMKLIKSYISNGTLLDAGCGYGTFLATAHKFGFKVMGCDISKEAVEKVKKTYKLRAVCAPIEPDKLPEGTFDVITSWDVIEHMSDPKLALSVLFKGLKPGGYLFMTTPDISSIDARLLGRFWYGFKKIPEHLYFFSPLTMRKFLDEAGYEVILIKPWGFQRSLAFCIEKLSQYSSFFHQLLKPLLKIELMHRISFFFPLIDMIIIARKRN